MKHRKKWHNFNAHNPKSVITNNSKLLKKINDKLNVLGYFQNQNKQQSIYNKSIQYNSKEF